MAEVALRADLKLATATLAAIEAAVAAGADDGMRPHLGASQIGAPCERALWYGFRWATARRFEPRLLRLFARGQREEDSLAGLLAAAGCDVVQTDPATGRQYEFKTGHFGGSMDGAIHALPDAPKTWHVIEFKTHNAKSFADLEKHGVEKSKPQHWAQMQCYMAWTGMTRALYVGVCKDDDRLHLERIDYDRSAAEALFAKAQRIIDAAEPLPRISERPDWYQCKLCDHHALCHGSAVPLPTCRSCAHVTPVDDGRWHCARHGKLLDVAEQKAGCQAHRFIPALLVNFADAVDADTEANSITYRHRVTGHAFINGLPPEGYESAEIHACADKAALGDPAVREFRLEFDARIVEEEVVMWKEHEHGRHLGLYRGGKWITWLPQTEENIMRAAA
jgi:hypothetical protein